MSFEKLPQSSERDAFESAVSRLPYPVFVVDAGDRLRAINPHARELWAREGLHEMLVARSPAHPLSLLVRQTRAGAADDEESAVVELSHGARYEVIHSSRSSKGASRWLVLMLRPFPGALAIDHSELRRRWSLTPREAEVAAACIAGRTNLEISRDLCISRETVKTHMARLLSKAGCESRSQLIAKFLLGGD